MSTSLFAHNKWPAYFADALDFCTREMSILLQRQQELIKQDLAANKQPEDSAKIGEQLNVLDRKIHYWLDCCHSLVTIFGQLSIDDDTAFECQRLIDDICYRHGPGHSLRQSCQIDPDLPRFIRGPKKQILHAVLSMLSYGKQAQKMMISATPIRRNYWRLSWQVSCQTPWLPKGLKRWIDQPPGTIPPSLAIPLELAVMSCRAAGGDIMVNDQDSLILTIDVHRSHQDEVSSHELHQRNYDRNVLVVEANLVQRNEHSRILQMCGCTVIARKISPRR